VVDRGSLTHAKSRARKRNAPREGGAESDPENHNRQRKHAIAAQVGHEISARFRRGHRRSLRPSLSRNAIADGAESASTRASAQSNHLGIVDKERGRGDCRGIAQPPRRARPVNRGEARRDGQLRVLAVLDLNPEALAAEVKRLAEREDDAVLAVEAIDRATWLAMRRLETTGMLKLAEGSIRVLHRASGLTADHPAGDQAGRASELQRRPSGRCAWPRCSPPADSRRKHPF
jgi:hypothetical protein